MSTLLLNEENKKCGLLKREKKNGYHDVELFHPDVKIVIFTTLQLKNVNDMWWQSIMYMKAKENEVWNSDPLLIIYNFDC